VLNVAVCSSLVAAGERQDEESIGGQRRSEALMMLTEMCPSHALTIRSLCVRKSSSRFSRLKDLWLQTVQVTLLR